MRIWSWLRGWEYIGNATSGRTPISHHAYRHLRRKINNKISDKAKSWQKKHKDKSTSFHAVAYAKDSSFSYKAKGSYSFSGHSLKSRGMKIWRKKR